MSALPQAVVVTDDSDLAPVPWEYLEEVGELDRWLDPHHGALALPIAVQATVRRRLVYEAFERHLRSSPTYRAYAARHGVTTASDVSNPELLPVIPTDAFKHQTVLSGEARDVIKWCRSSGTLGSVSTVPRDRASLERLIGSVRVGLQLLDEWQEHELEVLNLGPHRREAGDVWFAYVMSLVEVLYSTTHYVGHGVLDVDRAMLDLEHHLDSVPHVGVVGPPFFVWALAERIRDRRTRINAGGRLTILTAGGWKRASGQTISRPEFTAGLVDGFGLDRADQVRDAFNQVELNTVFLECAGGAKHVPPWVVAVARDPRDLAPVAHGEVGLLSFLDASAASYPGFIVGDDVGTVQEGPCACGRDAVVIDVIRRVERLEAKGCSLTIDGRYGGTP